MNYRSMCLMLLGFSGLVSAYKQCPMPGGSAGECRPLKQCKPLQELNKKRVQTKSELLYISQSKCGTMANFQIMVCCPPEPLWSEFIIFKPVIINEEINFETVTREKYGDTSDNIFDPSVDAINKSSAALGENKSNSISPDGRYTNRNIEQSEKKLGTRSSIPTFGCGQQNSYQNRIKGESELQFVSTHKNNYMKFDAIFPIKLEYVGGSARPGNPINLFQVDNALATLQKLRESLGDWIAYDQVNRGTATEIDQYPWLVLLEYKSKVKFCGGSLITTRYVLTAAHCIRQQTKPKFARLAEYNTTSDPTDYVNGENITVERVPIAKNIAHPNFTRADLHHDIGLSKLSKDAVLSEFIRLICLPDRDLAKSFHESMEFMVAGWGSDGIKFSDVKKSVRIPFVALHKCRLVHVNYDIQDSQICAGGNLGEDSCKGDSGGPLMYGRNNTFVVVGIVSYGKGICGLKNVPGVYTYVYPYLDWLQENMI